MLSYPAQNQATFYNDVIFILRGIKLNYCCVNFRALILFVILAAGMCGCVMHHNNSQTWTVSFANLKLGHNEFIQGVDLTVTNGNIIGVNHLPYGWDIQITRVTPVQYLTMRAGHFGEGCDNIHKLDEIITIEKTGGILGINATLFTDTAGTNYPNSRVYNLNHDWFILK